MSLPSLDVVSEHVSRDGPGAIPAAIYGSRNIRKRASCKLSIACVIPVNVVIGSKSALNNALTSSGTRIPIYGPPKLKVGSSGFGSSNSVFGDVKAQLRKSVLPLSSISSDSLPSRMPR